MQHTKRVLTIGSALVTMALLAACSGAPVPENGAMPTITPQDNVANPLGAQQDDASNPTEPQRDDAANPLESPRNAPAPDESGAPQSGRLGARRSRLDLGALDDPDKPSGAPAYTGTVISAEGDALTALAAAYTADSQASAPSDATRPNNRPDDDTLAYEEKTFSLGSAFRVKRASFERPTADAPDNGQPREAPLGALTEITLEQLQKNDQIVIWTDESGNAVYAIAYEGMGPGGRGAAPQGEVGPQRGDRPQQERQ